MTDAVRTLKEWTDVARKSSFSAGRGVTESGIPDFRSNRRLYHQGVEIPSETILSHTFYKSNPEEFFAFTERKCFALTQSPTPPTKSWQNGGAEGSCWQW